MKFSIVTPSFNQGTFIERTLQSVADQTGFEIEHVVFDGGSTDRTVDILKARGNSISWTSAPDRGQADAVNQGIRATSGEIIGWLNSDDVYYPGAFAQVSAFFEAHADIDVVYGMADHIDRDDVAFEAYPTEPWDFSRLKDICFICQPAVFFRRRVIEQHGFLDEKLHYCMDYEYWLRLGKAGARFAYLESKLAGSRLYLENKTLGSRIEVHAEINDMQRALFGTVRERWIWNYAHAVVEKRADRAVSPRWFAVRLLASAAAAALRWNGRISPEMKLHIKDLWRRFRS
jgi:glycosyltransferase involved in cell wall biosynthesis